MVKAATIRPQQHVVILMSVVAMHAAAVWLASRYSVHQSMPPLERSIMISVLPAPAAEPRRPARAPQRLDMPHVAPEKRPRVSPPPVIAAPVSAPAQASASTSEKQEAPVSVPPEPAAVEPPVAAAAVPAPASAPAVLPPTFNADYLNNPSPAYPPLSRRLGEEGRVVLGVFVDPRGLPERVELRTSSGHTRLDDVAVDTVKHWKFSPARRGNESVSAWVLVPISFNLRS